MEWEWGFYWVQMAWGGGWQPACLDAFGWQIVGGEKNYPEDQVAAVGPLIEPPLNQNPVDTAPSQD